MKTLVSKFFSVLLAASMLFAPVLGVACELPHTTHSAETHDTHYHNHVEAYESWCFDGMGEDFPILTSSLAQSYYNINDEFTATFSAENFGEITSVTVTNNGFTLVGAPVITSDSEFTVTFKAAETTLSETSVTLTALSADGETLAETLYAYYAYGKMFVSNLTATNAYAEYLAYELDNEMITAIEYENKFSEYCSQCVVSSAFVTPSMQNIGGEYETNVVEPTGIVIRGTATWIDDAGTSFPLQYVKVDLYSVYAGNIIRTTYTNEQGVYSFAFDDAIGIYGQEFFVRVYAEGEAVRVVSQSSGTVRTVYSVNSATATNVESGEITTINLSINMSNEAGQAMQISQATILASRFIYEMDGEYLSDVDVVYPRNDNKDGCDYSGGNKIIRIVEPTKISEGLRSYSSWDVLMHEYGHHVQREYGLTNSPAGSHSSSDNYTEYIGMTPTDDFKPNVNNILDAVELAWGEGWPSIFGEFVQRHYFENLTTTPHLVSNNRYNSYNGRHYSYETGAEDGVINIHGEANERMIMLVLWDIYDSESDDSDSTEDFDQLDFSESEVWNLMSNSEATTMAEFVEYFESSRTPSECRKLGDLLSYTEIAVSEFSTTTLMSESAPTLTWSANGIANSIIEVALDTNGDGTNDTDEVINCHHNRFSVRIYNSDYEELAAFQDISFTTSQEIISGKTYEYVHYTLPLAQWQQLVATTCDEIYFEIESSYVEIQEDESGNKNEVVIAGPYKVTYQRVSPHVHSYTYIWYSDVDHYAFCACRHSFIEGHQWSNGTCSYCETEHAVHSYTYASNGEETHTGTCFCGTTISAAHDWVGNSCGICGESHSHSYSYTSTNSAHTGTCSCGDIVSSTHIWNNGRCTVCGRAHSHSYSYTYTDTTHTGTCTCGVKTSGAHTWNSNYRCTTCNAQHTHSYTYTSTATTHTGTCSCGLTTSGSHSWVNGVCSVCNRTHAHSYTYTSNRTTHTGTCSCGKTVTANHIWVGTKCKVCGRVKSDIIVSLPIEDEETTTEETDREGTAN